MALRIKALNLFFFKITCEISITEVPITDRICEIKLDWNGFVSSNSAKRKRKCTYIKVDLAASLLKWESFSNRVT